MTGFAPPSEGALRTMKVAEHLRSCGHEVQTVRLATPPWEEWCTAEELPTRARELEQAALAAGMNFLSLGPCSAENVPAVVDACPGIPIIAAGGITDGRGIIAALALGASGVWVGSRFVASHEWAGPDWAKQALTEVGADDTVITKSYDLATDAPFPFQVGHRVIRNQFTDKWHQNYEELLEHKEDLKTDIALAMENADLTIAPVNAGSGSGSIKSVDNVSEIISTLMDEAESVLKNLT